MSAIEKETVLENEINEHENTVDTEDNKAYEELAKSYGWNSSGVRTAKEYILYALDNLPKKNAALEIKNKVIEDKDKKLAEMEVILNQLSIDVSKQKEQAYQQALNDIKMQRNMAISQGDAALVEQLDMRQENIKQEFQNTDKEAKDMKEQAYNKLLIDNFREENNQWIYGKSVDELEMQAYAKQLEAVMTSQGMDLKEQLDALNQAIHKKYHDYFEEKEVKPAVEGVQVERNVITKGKKTYTINDLNDAQRMAAKYLADRGTMTVENYIKKLIETGDLA